MVDLRRVFVVLTAIIAVLRSTENGPDEKVRGTKLWRTNVMGFEQRKWGVVAGFNGFVAVVMGAVGAHAVADVHLATLVESASLYELIHAVALLWLCGQRGKFAPAARWFFLIGTVLFCGALYLKAMTGWDAIVRLAPFGGVSFMVGWLLIALECYSPSGRAET
jgi:uncharacterized membrane protein YgdD (TMEM256/DUF423 family)